LQRAGRVLRDVTAAGATVLRRTTTGTAVALDGGMLVSLALPAIDTVFRDTTLRTVLNRNLRAFLAGFAHAGIRAAYFGREWLAWERRPIAVCGLEMTPSGALLLELLATARGGLELPGEAMSDLERSVDRYRGRRTACLDEVAPGRELRELAADVLTGIADRAGLEPLEVQPDDVTFDVPVLDAESPLPPGAVLLPPRPVPIGWLDVARTAAGVWVGGDVLAPSYALGVGRPGPEGAPMEGASWADVERAHGPDV
jgi:hypothetical protein